MAENQFSSHSADVEMWLDCGTQGRVELSRVTSSAVVAKDPKENIPSGFGHLIVVVDGKRTSVPVRVSTASKARSAAKVVAIDDSAPF